MKKIRRITALCLLAAFTVIAFAGCGAANDVPENPIICVSLNYGENSSTPSGNAGSQTPSGNQSGSQTPSSTTPSASTPDASTPSAETPDASTPSAETPDASTPSDNGGSASTGAPSTVAEIVNYYKECYNKIATEGSGATLTYNKNSNSPNVLEIGDLSSIAGTLMNQFLTETQPNEAIPVADVAPKGVTTCNLTEDMVAEATCTDNGDTYTVHIKLNCTQDNPDVNPSAGGGKAGTIVDVVLVEDITGAAGSFINFENVQNQYFDTEVTATIEKSTGHITELYTVSPTIMSFGSVSVKPFGFPSIDNARIGLTYENRYTITY